MSTQIQYPYQADIPSYETPPKIQLQFRMLRDGEVTENPKLVRIYRSWDTVGKLELAFLAEDGEFSQTLSVSLAEMLAQGEWLVTGLDDEVPRRTRAAYMSFSESGVVLFNISAGEGGGPSGDPASVEAIVRVDGFAATRTVVALERQGDGEWRVGGHTEISGGGELQLRTLGGPIYAVAIDDYGVAFTSALAVLVGQRIRPSQFRGWLYEITQAGQLPATEPEWWPIEGDNAPRELGTARAVAVRYYRPLAHGPVPVEMI